MIKKIKIPIILSLIVLISTIIGILIIVFYSRQEKQEIRIQAVAETVLSIPGVGTKIINEVFSVDIGVDTGTNSIYGADLEISFNPQVLEVQDIQPGSFFTGTQEINKSIDNTNGRVIYSFGSFSGAQGTGALASITFKAVGGGASSIAFGSSTSVAAAGEPEGLAATQDGSVSVLDVVDLTFQIKFQGISTQKADKNVRIILKQASLEQYSFDPVTVTANQGGVYSGTISGIAPGTYDVYIKGREHLDRRFSSIGLLSLINTEDWSGTELLTGDADNNNTINIQDFGILVVNYYSTIDNPADFNLDSITNIQDFRFIAENYLLTGDQ